MQLIPGLLAATFACALGVAVVVRIVLALVRRRPGSIRRDVLQPFAGSAAVLSKAYGWQPVEPPDLTVDERSAPDETGGMEGPGDEEPTMDS